MKVKLLFFSLLAYNLIISQTIVIDPGHGYCSDCTQSSCTSAVRTDTEILTAMSVGNKLKVLLDNNCSTVTAHLTRSSNACGDFPSLSARETMSNNWNADRFLSIHCNGGGGTGTETFWCDNGPSSNSGCQAFSNIIQNKIVAAGNFNSRRVVEDNSYLNFHLGVLNNLNAVHCLSEIGFADNSSDRAKLESNTYRDAFAQAYVEAFESSLGFACTGSNPPTLDCQNAVALTCGVSYSGAASSAPSAITTFGCNTWTETGPERVHTITPTANGSLTASLSNYTGDLDVYILGSCDPNDCIGTVNSDNAVLTNAVAGTTYYIVVDADDGSGSAYDLVVTCPNTTPEVLDCSNAIALTCGVPYTGASSAATSNVSNYGCNNSNQTGPERVHTITPLSNGSITAVVSNFTGDLDVFILESCDASDCSGIVFQDSAIFANVVAGQTYYIVVDSDNGSGSAYDLIVKCQAIGGNNEDITVSNATISPLAVNAGGIITTNSDLNYSGSLYTSDINDVDMDYFLSTDCTLSNEDVYLGGSISSLGVDNPSSSESINVSIPINTTAGTYYILFVGDNGQDVSENDETNNVSCVQITVNGAAGANDIFLSNVSTNTDSIVAGQAIDVSSDQNYSGNQTSNNLASSELNYYLSTDCSLSSDDVLLGDDISTLGSDITSSNETESLVIPINTESGVYYILFIADDNNAISENNENNNVECIVLIIDGEFVSIDDEDLKKHIDLFPNPTDGLITINSSSISIKNIEIYNNLGVLIQSTNNSNEKINMASYANGLYFIKIISENNKSITLKVTKQ